MQVFVTGGSGFVGGHLIRALVAAGYGVSALARSAGSAASVSALGARPVSGELGAVAVEGLRGVDCVIHAAAYVEGGRSYFIADQGIRSMREFLDAQAANEGVSLGSRSIPGALARPISVLVEGLWTLLGLRMLGRKGPPPLTRFAVAMMSRPVTVRTDRAKAELNYAPVITVEEDQLDRARGPHPEEAVAGLRAVLRLLVIFALVTPFWSLFDQKASTWVLQAGGMSRPVWFQPSQMQALNPALVMLLIPFNNLVLYPLLGRAGLKVTALRRMTAGIAFSGVAWIVVGAMQLRLDDGAELSILWQILPYALLTFGEVLVSATGLEFAYSQAPLRTKSALMAFWSLSVTVGNLWVLLVNASVKSEAATAQVTGLGLGVTAFQMFFFAGFALVAAAVFGLVAARFPVEDRYRAAGA